MQPSEWLAVLNILVAFLGVAFAVFAAVEWWRLRTLRQEMSCIEKRTLDALHSSLKATHRIIASYQVTDPDARIPLLESALRADPAAYNGWNSLGYAWLEKKDYPRAIDAFSQAVRYHPEDKAGYCDLAYAHLCEGHEEIAVRYLREAMRADSTVRDDILADRRFSAITPQFIVSI